MLCNHPLTFHMANKVSRWRTDAPFVMMEEGQFLYNVTHDLCKRNGFVPKTVVECYNLETALHMVKAGVGISIIPDLMSKLVGGLNYYNIKGLIPQSQISVVYRRDRHLTKEAKELIELIKKRLCLKILLIFKIFIGPC